LLSYYSIALTDQGLREGGLLKPSEYHHMGGWPDHHVTFIAAKNA